MLDNDQADALKAGDQVVFDGHRRYGELLDVYDDRRGDPFVWRVRLASGEIVMEQADRLRKVG